MTRSCTLSFSFVACSTLFAKCALVVTMMLLSCYELWICGASVLEYMLLKFWSSSLNGIDVSGQS